MIAEAEGGAGWLREWIQLWVQGDITTNVAGLLRRSGGKIRPIALTEALVNWQKGLFSVWAPGGAEAVIGALRQKSM